MQQGRNMIHSVGSAFNRTLKSINKAKHVRFKVNNSIRIIKNPNVVMMTYDSGADRTYISERDRAKAGLPILRQSS
jgi:NACalpha-BTF3-like transcription factor